MPSSPSFSDRLSYVRREHAPTIHARSAALVEALLLKSEVESSLTEPERARRVLSLRATKKRLRQRWLRNLRRESVCLAEGQHARANKFKTANVLPKRKKFYMDLRPSVLDLKSKSRKKLCTRLKPTKYAPRQATHLPGRPQGHIATGEDALRSKTPCNRNARS